MKKTDGCSFCGLSRWWDLSKANSLRTELPFLSDVLCRHFSLEEIQKATNNFDEALIIGKGSFSNVYRGYIDGGNTRVAIKRLNRSSRHEFLTEIEILSQLRHHNVISLIGYCDDKYMCFVFDYMMNGTLYYHLHETKNDPLPWKRRLEICIGAAKGLHHLHAGARHAIIHRDVKSSNILLDKEWVALISDFGSSKMVGSDTSVTPVTTMIRGTMGHLDPEYMRTGRLTEKTDVYSFGVVLFEVLSGRKAVNRFGGDDGYIILAHWVQMCIQNGTPDNIIDPHLIGIITPASLEKFVEIGFSCLSERGIERPAMGNVVQSLEFALQLQERPDAANENLNIGDEPLNESMYRGLSFWNSYLTDQQDVASSQGGSFGSVSLYSEGELLRD